MDCFEYLVDKKGSGFGVEAVGLLIALSEFAWSNLLQNLHSMLMVHYLRIQNLISIDLKEKVPL